MERKKILALMKSTVKLQKKFITCLSRGIYVQFEIFWGIPQLLAHIMNTF